MMKQTDENISGGHSPVGVFLFIGVREETASDLLDVETAVNLIEDVPADTAGVDGIKYVLFF